MGFPLVSCSAPDLVYRVPIAVLDARMNNLVAAGLRAGPEFDAGRRAPPGARPGRAGRRADFMGQVLAKSPAAGCAASQSR